MGEGPQELHNAVRRYRETAGLTQAELAERVGVSRQTIHGIEHGRAVPSVAIALRLARALGVSVEGLFWLEAPEEGLVARLIEPVAEVMVPVVTGVVGGQWVAWPVRPGRAAEANAVLTGRQGAWAVLRPLAPVEQLRQTLLIAGCAPALAVVARRLSERFAPLGARWIEATSARALELLERGEVHVAGLHLRDAASGEYNAPIVARRAAGRRMSLIHLVGWTQGLVLPPGNPRGLRSAADLGAAGLRVAWRPEGSGAREVLTRLLAEAGVAAAGGVRAEGHEEVAQLVAAGAADVGVAIEPVARAAGCAFVPLEEERFDLVVAAELLDDARVGALLELMHGEALRFELGEVGGYGVASMGQASLVGEVGA